MTIQGFYNSLAIVATSAGRMWRPGQVLFNHLRNVRPDLAEQIRATDNDPFFSITRDDPRYVNAIKFIEENW